MTTILSRLSCCLTLLLIVQVSIIGQGQVAFFVDLTRVVTLHEPVLLTVSIVNDSDSDLFVDMGNDGVGHFEFYVESPSGDRRTIRAHGPVEGAVGPSVLVLGPKGSGSKAENKLGGPVIRTRVLDEWVDFSIPGSYRVTVRFDGTIRAGTGVVMDAVLRSQTYTVTVGPRDEGLLRRKALVLLQEAEGFAAEKGLATEQLAYMIDPAIVPLLERGTTEKLSPFYCETLARIGTPEARQALERLAQNPTAWIAAYAKAALSKIK